MWMWVLIGFVWVLLMVGVAASLSLSGRMQQRLETNERRRRSHLSVVQGGKLR